MRTLGKILIALAFTCGLLYWCFHQVNWSLFLGSLKNARWPYLLPAFSVSLLILAFNSIQWKLFLPKFSQVGFVRMFELISVFSMTVNVIPFWGGHALMLYLLGQREKVGKTVALSAVTLDQIVEGPAKLLLFAIIFWWGPFPPWMEDGMGGLTLAVILGYLFLMTMAWRHRENPDENLKPVTHLLGKIRLLVARWAHHLHALRSWRRLLLSTLLAVTMKFLEVAAVYLLQKSMGVPLGWQAAFLVTAALSLATSLPLTPGRLGIFEAAAMLTYQYLSLPAATALAMGILIHAAHTLPFIVAGYLSSLKLGLRFGQKAAVPGLLTQAES